MIPIFRKTRKKMADDNKPAKYLRYAIGEIVLVVIGILIALSINNWNENRKIRNQELKYLENLRTDFNLNLDEIDQYLESRTSSIESANKVIEYYEGKPLTDLNDLNFHATNVYIWYKFTLQDNTYQELVNSGNLAIISNDSIKNGLLNLQSLYDKLKNEEEHYRYDAEMLLYEPVYRMIDMNDLIKNFTYQASNGNAGVNVDLSRANYETMLKDLQHKNGFVMAVYEFSVMNSQLNELKDLSSSIIRMINKELESIK